MKRKSVEIALSDYMPKYTMELLPNRTLYAVAKALGFVWLKSSNVWLHRLDLDTFSEETKRILTT